MTTKEKRDDLRERIERGEAYLAQRDFAKTASDAARSATDFVKAHPIASIAGVAAIGILLGAMTRPGRRLGSRAAGLVSYATEAGIAYALGVLDSAGELADDAREAGTDKIERFSDNVERTVRKVKREGGYLAASARDAVHDIGRRAGRRTGRSIRQTRNRLTH